MKRQNKQIKVIVYTVAIIAIFILLQLEVRSEREWMCAECGASRLQSRWFNLLDKDFRYRNSPLQRWLLEHRLKHDHDWKLIIQSRKNILSKTLSSGYGDPPSIYLLRTDLMEDYLKTLTAGQTMDFYRAIRNSSPQERFDLFENVLHSVLTEQ